MVTAQAHQQLIVTFQIGMVSVDGVCWQHMMRASYSIVGSHMCVGCFVLITSSNHHDYYDHDDDDHHHHHHRSVERNDYGNDVPLRRELQSGPVEITMITTTTTTTAVSSVTWMGEMFNGASSFNQDLSSWDGKCRWCSWQHMMRASYSIVG